MQDCDGFGKMVAAEAHRRNFQAASRGSLLGDGSAWIWNLHEKWFSGLVPIVEVSCMQHDVSVCMTATVPGFKCHLNAAQLYLAWMTLCWQGKVRQVIEDLEARLARLEPCTDTGKLADHDPREALRRTLTYLKKQRTPA